MTTASPVALRAEPLSLREALDRHEPAWRELALSCTVVTGIMFPAFLRVWDRCLSNGHRPQVIVVTRAGTLRAVLPVVTVSVRRGPSFLPRMDYGPWDTHYVKPGRRPFPVRQLSPIVSWEATSVRPSFLSAEDDAPDARKAVAACLAAWPGADQIVVPAYKGRDAAEWMEALGAAGLQPFLHHLDRRVLSIRALRHFDDLIAQGSRNFRKGIRRARRAAEATNLQLTVHHRPEDVRAQLDEFAQLAEHSWKASQDGTAKYAIGYHGRQRAFFEAMLAEPNSGLHPVLSVARLDGTMHAAKLCLRCGDTLLGLLTFRRAGLPDLRAGYLVLGALIDWATDHHLGRFDLNTTQDWLEPVADSEHKICNVAAFRPTTLGRLYGPIAAMARHRHAGRTRGD